MPSPRPRLALAAALLALAAPALIAPAAEANAGIAVLKDCVDNNGITHHYSLQVLQQALADLSRDGDASEYSDCGPLIRRAEVQALGQAHAGGKHPSARGESHSSTPAASGARGGSGGSGGGTPHSSGSSQSPSTPTEPSATGALTPSQQTAVDQAAARDVPVEVGGHNVQPGLVHVSVASAVSALPAPLLVVFLLVLTAGLFAGGRLVRRTGVYPRRKS